MIIDREQLKEIMSYDYPFNVLRFIEIYRKENCFDYHCFTDDNMNGLEYALSKLDSRKKEMLVMRFKEHMTYKEIGDIYSITDSCVLIYIPKIIEKLGINESYCYIKFGVNGYNERKNKLIESNEIENLSGEDIDILNLPIRAYHALKREKISKIGDIFNYELCYLRRIRNFSDGSMDFLKKAFQEFGVYERNGKWYKNN